MKRQLVRLMGVTSLLLSSLMLVPAAQAADEVGLSHDGVTWSSTLSGNLFDQIDRWVPGDSEVSSFYVRNQGPSKAILDVEVRSADTDALLRNSDIKLRVRAGDGPWFGLKNSRASKSLVARGIPRGNKVRVDINALFDPASTNQSQLKSVALDFVVRLADSREGIDSGKNPPPHGDNALLPSTGSVVKWWFVWTGAILVGVGLAFVTRRRDRDKEVSNV